MLFKELTGQYKKEALEYLKSQVDEINRAWIKEKYGLDCMEDEVLTELFADDYDYGHNVFGNLLIIKTC